MSLLERYPDMPRLRLFDQWDLDLLEIALWAVDTPLIR